MKYFLPPIIALLAPLSAQADLLGDCASTASQINKNTPHALDRVTTLMNAVCMREGREVVLVYRNEVSAAPGALTQQRLNENLRPKVLGAWCTDPVQRRTLDLINIRYTYYQVDGRYIGKMDLNRDECR